MPLPAAGAPKSCSPPSGFSEQLMLKAAACRFEDEAGELVLYVYEIQLDGSVQRQVRLARPLQDLRPGASGNC